VDTNKIWLFSIFQDRCRK